MNTDLQGTFTAMITPFDGQGEVDYKKLEEFIHFQIENKIEGLVPCGTTGESPTLSHDEHRKVISETIRMAKAKKNTITIIAGTGSNSTREAIALTKFAATAGADYALVVNPYYNKPTQKGLVEHFTAIADESEIPLVLYNIPGRTSVKIELDTMIHLSKHKNIHAVKEATGDISFMTQVIENTNDDFSLLSGDDNLLAPVMAIGGKGVISVISNIFPLEASDVTREYLANNYDKAQELFSKLFPLCGVMFLETNPIPVKYAASLEGHCENSLRLPMTPLSKEYETKVQQAIQNFKKAMS